MIASPTNQLLHLTANMMLTHPEYAAEFREALSRYEAKLQDRKRKAVAPAPDEPDPKIPRVEGSSDTAQTQQASQSDYFDNETDEHGVPTQFVAELAKTGLGHADI